VPVYQLDHLAGGMCHNIKDGIRASGFGSVEEIRAFESPLSPLFSNFPRNLQLQLTCFAIIPRFGKLILPTSFPYLQSVSPLPLTSISSTLHPFFNRDAEFAHQNSDGPSPFPMWRLQAELYTGRPPRKTRAIP